MGVRRGSKEGDKMRGDGGKETKGGREFWDSGGDSEKGEDRAVVEGRKAGPHLLRSGGEEDDE